MEKPIEHLAGPNQEVYNERMAEAEMSYMVFFGQKESYNFEIEINYIHSFNLPG